VKGSRERSQPPFIQKSKAETVGTNDNLTRQHNEQQRPATERHTTFRIGHQTKCFTMVRFMLDETYEEVTDVTDVSADDNASTMETPLGLCYLQRKGAFLA
jgi:hypothetical protein